MVLSTSDSQHKCMISRTGTSTKFGTRVLDSTITRLVFKQSTMDCLLYSIVRALTTVLTNSYLTSLFNNQAGWPHWMNFMWHLNKYVDHRTEWFWGSKIVHWSVNRLDCEYVVQCTYSHGNHGTCTYMEYSATYHIILQYHLNQVMWKI